MYRQLAANTRLFGFGQVAEYYGPRVCEEGEGGLDAGGRRNYKFNAMLNADLSYVEDI